VGHYFFNGFAYELLRIELYYFANQFSASAQCEGKSSSYTPFIIMQLRDRIGIDWIFVDRVTSVTMSDGITRVARADFIYLNLQTIVRIVFKHPAITEFRASADMHDVAGNKPRFL